MNTRLNVFASGAAGGLLGGGLLGLLEASFHIVSAGAPDYLAPFYAVVLYGLLGTGFGCGAGLLMGALPVPAESAIRKRVGFSHSLGAVFAVVPMLGFILFYLSNKLVFAEQGVPLWGKLAILGILVVGAGLELTVGAKAAGGAGYKVARPIGSLGVWAGMAVVTGLLAVLPLSSDPRDSFAHGKSTPESLAGAPDVLLLTIDTLRADYLGAYGREGGLSPVLDGIAADGIVFEDASAHASWTRSSFASLWTSRIPAAHNTATKASRLSDDLVLLSEVLQTAGVTTGNLANNINVTETFNFDQGYDSFVYEAPAYHFGATESVFALTFYKVVHKLREKIGGSKEITSFYQPADVVLGDAKAFVEANPDSRWMLGVHLMEPHDPYFEHPYLDGSGTAQVNGVGFARAEVEHPSLDQAEYLKRVYADEIKHMDGLLEPFVAWLKESGRYDNTLIVITADHGEEFGEHGGFWHGTTLFEEQTHVPLIVKLPKQELAGERVTWQARLIDVAPTVATALGLAPDPTWAGKDLLADVRKDLAARAVRTEAEERARETVGLLAEAADAGTLEAEQLEDLRAAQRLLAPVEPDACPTHPLDRVVVSEQDFEGNVLSAVRRSGLKLIVANEGNPRGLPVTSLFDLHADAAEQSNLAPDGQVCGEDASQRISQLQTVLEAEQSLAKSGAVQAEDVEVDASEICNLCALGYMDGPKCDDC